MAEPKLFGAVPAYVPSGKKVGVMTAFPTSGRLVGMEQIISMSTQQPPTHMSTAMVCVKGAPIDKAREICAEKALEAGAKYLWFVDDDTVPPPNTLKRLVSVLDNNPDAMVAGGVYVTRQKPEQPLVFRGMGLGSFWHWKVGDIFEVSGMGAGCMLINTDVFKHLEAPYFPWPSSDSYDPHVPSTSISEDISFCNKVREAGFKILAHGGILCDHWNWETQEVFRMPPDSYPMRSDVVISNEGIVRGATVGFEDVPDEKEK